MLIFFVRHGLTDWNVQRRFQGTCDIPLNDTGLAQARAAASRCAQLHIQRIYHSTLCRAAKTAEIVAGGTGAPLCPFSGFNEVCLGAFQGLTRQGACEQFPAEAALYFADNAHNAPPGGESLLALQSRALAALDDAVVRAQADGLQRIAIVSHGALLKALFCGLLAIPLANFGRFDISNGSISVVEGGEGSYRVVTLNDLSHFGDPYGAMTSNRLMI